VLRGKVGIVRPLRARCQPRPPERTGGGTNRAGAT